MSNINNNEDKKVKEANYSLSLSSFLERHKAKESISFHMPGHKGHKFYEKYGINVFAEDLPSMDITEIEGADNLFQPEGVIAEINEKYKTLYDVHKSYILINGSSCGIIASILTSVAPGEKLIVARNCHKSVFSALSLGGIEPVYIEPDFEVKYGIMGGIDPVKIEKALREDGDIKAVILPSPNYYGILSDIKALKSITEKYNATLIVDQAHGAHLRLMDKMGKTNSMSACTNGADIVINSTHKTLASFTQTAVLNVNSDRVDIYDLEEKLAWMQSTSPSYILMLSLDINADILGEHKEKLMNEWLENLEWFYDELKLAKIRFIGEEKLAEGTWLDHTKINVDLGIDGKILEKELIERNIFPELYTGNIMMLMTGVGTARNHLEKLLDALIEIKVKYKDNAVFEEKENILVQGSIANQFKGIGKKKEMIPIRDAIGKVASASIIPYPPGIPLICPGEIISKESVDYALELRAKGEKVIGITENESIAIYTDI